MRKILALLMICFLSLSALPAQAAASTEDDMRGIWISTVYGLDYPSTKNNIAAQQSEFIEKLDELQKVGINTVFVQVRPKADALYASSINPWSDVLTGVQGKSPGYDPMAFMIEETHKRGMEFHAWLNPYRVTTSGTDLSVLSENHPARKNPSWTFSYNNALYYNPELEAVKQHIVDTVKEIVTYYDVDGIHFDDYFYPSSYPLPAGEGKDGAVANARREAVNDMVKRVSETVKTANTSAKKSITFGISPPGIWKNSSSDATGSATSGRESYYAVFADCRTWIKNEWIDYITPQIYWQTGHDKADYETLVKWWSNEVSGTNVKLYIGQGIYTDAVATQIDTQLTINQKYSQVSGSIYFSLRDLLNNRMSCKDKISKFYAVSTGGSTGSDNNSGSNNNTNSGSNSGSSGSGNNTNSGSSGTTVSPIGKTGTVTAVSLNIRAGARVDRDIVAKVSEGTKLSILDVLGDWYKVKLANGTVGWANSSYIRVEISDSNTTVPTPTPSQPSTGGSSVSYPAQGTVTATTLNIRAGARVDRDIVAKVVSGTKVTVASELNGWYKVKLADGTVGWASKEYIQLSSASNGSTSGSTAADTFPRTAAAISVLNIRSGARVDRPLVTTVQKGTPLTLLDSLGDWYKVRLANGTVGWAVKSYIA